MNIRQKLPSSQTSIFAIMSGMAHQHHAINLSQGFPDFKSDQVLIDLVTKAMNSGYNQYAPMPGLISLREQISAKFDRLYHTSYDPDKEITITAGATQALFTAITAFVHKDDEVIIFNPAYDCYQPAVELNLGKTISIQLKAPNYKVDWAQVKQQFSKKTKLIIFNTPHNPCGTIWDEEDLKSLENLVAGTDCIVISDEVYEHIIFDHKKHQSACLFPTLKAQSMVIASFGKTFHNTGWKMGYCCAPSELMVQFRKVHQFNVFSVNHPIQVALTTYLKNENNYLGVSQFYQEKRDFFLSAISGSRFKIVPAQGTYFQLLDYSDITDEYDVEYAKRIVLENGLASIPVSVFNENNYDQQQLRFCFAKENDTLEQAAEIICNI